APCIRTRPPHGPMRMHPAIAPATAKTPAVPWIIIHVETPGPWTWPPEPWPGSIIVTGAIDHHAVLHVRAQITRGVTYVHYVRGMIVDVHITHVVSGTFRGDRSHLGRYFGTY